jgi:lipid-A-disaccharide synthase
MPSKRIMIIAGEASGDMHGARLARSLGERFRDVVLFGVGSDAMRDEGVRIVIDSRELAVVGITEVISTLPTIYRALRTVRRALNHSRPDLLILIDFPDFNFRVAAIAKKLNIPVLYYISPQIWAWRQGRVNRIKQLVDHMAVIFPFEASFYRKHHVPVTFVGHPLLDRIPAPMADAGSPSGPGRPVIGLLPGSREKEVSILLPAMLQAAVLVRNRIPEIRFLVSASPSVNTGRLESIVGPYTDRVDIQIVNGPVASVFHQSRLVVAASGTVTLEAALHGIPTIIVYKVSPLSYWLGRRLIKVSHIGIVNLIVQKELLPELIQDEASPEAISETVVCLVNEPEKLRRMKEELLGVRNLLGGPGASDRVASIAGRIIGRLAGK